jgi:hypothetical protein
MEINWWSVGGEKTRRSACLIEREFGIIGEDRVKL